MHWLLFNLSADAAEAAPLLLSNGSEARRVAVRLYSHLDAWLRENVELQPEKSTRERELRAFQKLPSLVAAAAKKATPAAARLQAGGAGGTGPLLSEVSLDDLTFA
mmetsp:Transcript_2850/g.8854  ORF Transcript_2850/g.8854 Transcript_2850/m.8854 type:complete len:106 (-) Transcript_2850:87-404(-)